MDNTPAIGSNFRTATKEREAETYPVSTCPLIWFTFLILLSFNIESTNHAFGIVGICFLMVFSMSSPWSALLALAGSQVVADPFGIPFSIAQCLFVGAFLQILRGKKIQTTYVGRISLFFLVPVIFFRLLTFLKYQQFEMILTPFELAVIYCYVMLVYMERLKGHWTDALFFIGLGLSLSYFSFLLKICGVPMVEEEFAKGNVITGLVIGRGDSNLYGVNIALSVLIIFNIALLKTGTALSRKLRIFMAGTSVMLGIPAMLSTMSRASFVYLGAGILLMLVMLPSKKSFFWLCGGMLAVILFFYDFFEQYLSAIWNLTQEQSLSNNSLFMSRTDVYQASIQEILNNPLLGTMPEGRVATSQYGFDYASHNVWLDWGRGGGIFAMLAFTVIYVFPLRRLWLCRKQLGELFVPFMIVMLEIGVVFMNLSLGNYKIFYIIWVMIMVMTDPKSNKENEKTC